MNHNYRLFLREYWRNFHDTGSIAPSSRWLAGALARHVTVHDAPRRLLEVGPGTGAVTWSIIRAMGPEDALDLVELNPAFAAHLRRSLGAFPADTADRVRIFEQNIEELAAEEPYQAIISGLPFNNFDPAVVELILARFCSLAAPGATISFFEYVGMRPAKSLVSGSAECARLTNIGTILGDFLGRFEFARELIWLNIPPAIVHHARPVPARSSSSGSDHPAAAPAPTT